MATGAEHYVEAERLLARADAEGPASDFGRSLTATAQVHATLAHAAATALAEGHRDNAAWCAAAGTPVTEEVAAR